jgi:hypothetical protein
MKQYLTREELATWPTAGKDGWIKMRFNRNYNEPYMDSDMDAYLCPTGPTTVRDITAVSNEIAQELYDTYGKIYVGMSGGIDSEWVAKSFHRQGIPFTPIIYEAEDLNAADSWWAHKWCADNGVKEITYKEYIFQYIKGIVELGSNDCLRTPGGPYVTTRLARYVEDQGGVLVTGAGFPELFPDPNIEYMAGRFLDNKLMNLDGTVKNAGWLFHEADFTINRHCGNHPWNFLSWRPDIVLSYIALRTEGSTEFNKARIFDCIPRPKSTGVPDVFWRSRLPLLEHWIRIKNRIGTSEVDYIGSTEQLVAVLTTGDINAS